ncbi:MAG: hypothetical protein H7210_07160 [Pyrinomonadaceae bacterium]|nr:hypothetical protein [Phycisphaerales bacterium]
MNILITRDSVCAGDDGDAPHLVERHNVAARSVHDLINIAVLEMPLASISGGQATWCLCSNIPLAVVAQQWKAPQHVALTPPKMEDLDVQGDAARFHFTYFAQHDPELVLTLMRRLRLRIVE